MERLSGEGAAYSQAGSSAPGDASSPLLVSADIESTTLERDISYARLPTRAASAIKRLLYLKQRSQREAYTFTLAQFTGLTVDDLRDIRGVGAGTIRDVVLFLEESSKSPDSYAPLSPESSPPDDLPTQGIDVHSVLVPAGLESVVLDRKIPWDLIPAPVGRSLQKLLSQPGGPGSSDAFLTLRMLSGFTVADLLALRGVGSGKVEQVLRFVSRIALSDAASVTKAAFAETTGGGGSLGPRYPRLLAAPDWLELSKETFVLYGGSGSGVRAAKSAGVVTVQDLGALLTSLNGAKVPARLRVLAAWGDKVEQILGEFEPASYAGLLETSLVGPQAQWPDRVHVRFGLDQDSVVKAFPQFPVVSAVLAMRAEGETLDSIGASVGRTRERVRQIILANTPFLSASLQETVLGGPERSKHEREVEESQWRQEVAARITQEILARPGLSITELASRVQVDPGQVRALIPDQLAKFVEGHEVMHGVGMARWTLESMTAAVSLAGTFYFPLSAPQYDELVELGEVVGPGSQTVAKRFGTWKNACLAAGVEPTTRGREHYDPKWSWDEMVGIVAEFLLDPTTSGSFGDYERWRREQPNAVPSGSLIRNRMDTWGDAVSYALMIIADSGPLDPRRYGMLAAQGGEPQ